MADNQKELTLQSYEKKIANTLREEKYELPSLVKNKVFLENIYISGNSVNSIANRFYKDKINKLHDTYINEFNEIIMPLILEKGLSFDVPEDAIREHMDKYELRVSRLIEKLQVMGRIQLEPFYNAGVVATNWSLCLDGIDNVPFMIALGSKRIIVLDENFNMDLALFASLGAMPDIRPITKAGTIDLPPNTFSINLQIMMDNEFKQVSILLLKQRLDSIESFLSFMVNIALIVDTKTGIEEDFSGLKWIKNSLQHSLFKKKEFLALAKLLKIGGLIIDKSVSPMQVQKIQALMKTNANMNIGFDINKLGTLQYSVIQKKETVPIAYDAFEQVICRIPDAGSKYSAM